MAATSIPLASTRVVARIKPDLEILAQLRLATSDERELQIISTTIELQAAAPAWSLQHGIVRYNERYYVPVTSPLLKDLLESLGTSAPHLLAIGLHTATSSPTTQAFPSSILLLEAWPQCILPSATIVLIDNNGQQFLSIDDTYIGRKHADGPLLISPANDNTGDLLFGTHPAG